jgi:hypothetical protein
MLVFVVLTDLKDFSCGVLPMSMEVRLKFTVLKYLLVPCLLFFCSNTFSGALLLASNTNQNVPPQMIYDYSNWLQNSKVGDVKDWAGGKLFRIAEGSRFVDSLGIITILPIDNPNFNLLANENPNIARQWATQYGFVPIKKSVSAPNFSKQNTPSQNNALKSTIGNPLVINPLVMTKIQDSFTATIDGASLSNIGQTLPWAGGVLTRTAKGEILYVDNQNGNFRQVLTKNTDLVALGKNSDGVRNLFISQFGVDMSKVGTSPTSSYSILDNLTNKMVPENTKNNPYLLGNGLAAYYGDNGKIFFLNSNTPISTEELLKSNEYKALTDVNMIQEIPTSDINNYNHGKFYSDFRDCMFKTLITSTKLLKNSSIKQDDYIKFAERAGMTSSLYKQVRLSLSTTTNVADITAETLQRLSDATMKYKQQSINKEEYVGVAKDVSNVMENYFITTLGSVDKITCDASASAAVPEVASTTTPASILVATTATKSVPKAAKTCPTATTSTRVFGEHFTCPSSVNCSDGTSSSRLRQIAFSARVNLNKGVGCTADQMDTISFAYSVWMPQENSGTVQPTGNGGINLTDASTCHSVSSSNYGFSQFKIIVPLTQWEVGGCVYDP